MRRESLAGILTGMLRPLTLGIYVFGGVALTMMMLIVGVDVFSRDVFNVSITGAFELTELMMGLVVSCGLAYCAMMKRHISADVLVSRLPERAKSVTKAVTAFISLGVTTLITWQCFVNMKATIGFGINSSILHIPIFPFIGVAGLGFGLFTLILLKDFLEILGREGAK
jgi:TRAP-type transport system small permease protein